MKSERRWLLWRFEPIGGRMTKVPLRVDGRRASSTDPVHWSTYETAARAAARIGANGLGFALGGGIVGVDLDHVRDPQNGAIVAWAARVIAALASYTEASPSGAGAHIILRGRKPAGRSNLRFEHGAAFECYDQGRFFTMTGQHVAGTPHDLRAVPDAVLAGVHAEMLARLPEAQRRPPPIVCRSSTGSTGLEDAEVLRRMFASRSGPELARLYHGEYAYPSQSDADMRLCGALAFWTGCDAAQMDRIFRASSLMREKWDERHGVGTYGARTIERACAGCTVTLSRR